MMDLIDSLCLCCRKRNKFAAAFLFSFLILEKGKCPQNSGFQAYGLPWMTAGAAKGSTASDAEPFAVTGAVSHNSQPPWLKHHGWRSFFFFSPT
jgi:hypothetical protein